MSGSEGDRQAVTGLPGVQRHQQVPGRVEAAVGQSSGEGGALLRRQRPGGVVLLGEALAEGEVAVLAPHRDPFQAGGAALLGGKVAVVGQGEADAAVAREEARVPLGHRRLDPWEVRVQELLGRRPLATARRIEGRAAGREGGGELLEIGGQEIVRDAEEVLQLGHEDLHVQRGGRAVLDAGDRGGVDEPVLERQHPGGEAVADIGAGDGELPGPLAAPLGGEDALVGELGERLGDQVTVGLLGDVGAEMGGGRGAGSEWRGGEVGAGADAQRGALGALAVGDLHVLQHPEAGRGVLGEHGAVALVGLDDHSGGASLVQAPGDHLPHHRGGEPVLRLPGGRGDQQVHAEVAGLRGEQPVRQQLRGVVGLDVDERGPVAGADPALPVLGGVDAVEVGAHLIGAVRGHAPEAGAVGGEPGVQQLGVGGGVQRGEGQVHQVSPGRYAAGGQCAAGRPKVWKAIARSIG